MSEWEQKLIDKLDNKEKTKSNNQRKSPKKGKLTEDMVPDFNDMIQFCLENYKDENDKVVDIELYQFLKHTLPREQHRVVFGFERGGGGWSGPAKCVRNVFIKMIKKGWPDEKT